MKAPIFALGTGRCGSTLLQRIINTSPNITLWGEHAGFLKGLAKSYHVLTKSPLIEKNFYSKPLEPSMLIGSFTNYRRTINWVNSFDKQTVQEDYRQLLVNLLNKGVNVDEVHWGFKEILYTKDDHVLNMLLELFPEALIIFSVRNPLDTIRSMILDWNPPHKLKKQMEDPELKEFKQLVEAYARRWQNSAGSFQYWIAEQSIPCYLKKYENLLQDPEKSVQEMFDFLNLPMPKTALKPMEHRVGTSQKSPVKSEVSNLVYGMGEDIWSIVGDTATYFGYELKKNSNLEAISEAEPLLVSK